MARTKDDSIRINEKLKETATALKLLADTLEQCADGKISRKTLGKKYGYNSQTLMHEIYRSFKLYVNANITEKLGEKDLKHCLDILEPVSDKILKAVFGIRKDAPVSFPKYSQELFYTEFLNHLEPSEKDLLLQYYQNRNTMPEIAVKQGVTRAAIHSKIKRILRKLRSPIALYALFPKEWESERKEYLQNTKYVRREINACIHPDKTKKGTSTSIASDLSTRSYNVLRRFDTIEDFTSHYPTKQDLLSAVRQKFEKDPRIRNLGRKSTDELILWMEQNGFY